MKKIIIYFLLSFVTLSSFAQINGGGGPGGMPPGGGMGGPGMGPGGPDGKGPDKMQAPKKEKKKKKAAEEEVTDGKMPGHVYIYGCSFEFGDSTIYFTQIDDVDSIAITKKTKFLPYRSDFSQQLKDKIEGPSYKAKNQTVSVFFSDKKSKLQKELAAMKKRCLKKGDVHIITLDDTDFKFVHPLDYYVVPNEQ